MATTFLDLTNELLRELNEVALTAANFAQAKSVQQHAKDTVNRAYFDIINSEPQWPFLAVAESGSSDPMYGNVYVETTTGTRWYELKEASSNTTTDYGSIDWDNFYLTTVGVNGETAPHTARNLGFTSTDEWKDFRRVSENLDDSDAQQYGVPTHVIRSPDARKFGSMRGTCLHGFLPLQMRFFFLTCTTLFFLQEHVTTCGSLKTTRSLLLLR